MTFSKKQADAIYDRYKVETGNRSPGLRRGFPMAKAREIFGADVADAVKRANRPRDITPEDVSGRDLLLQLEGGLYFFQMRAKDGTMREYLTNTGTRAAASRYKRLQRTAQ